MLALGSKRREPCAKCAMPVFIAERLLVGGRKLYHRTCFRCARCQNQLSLANFYETEDGQYCCEACPDEVDNAPPVVETLLSIDNSATEMPADIKSVETSLPPIEIKHDKALTDFMIGQLQWEDEEVAPPLPTTAPPLPVTSEPVLNNSVQTDVLNNINISYDNSAEAFDSDITGSLGNLNEDISPYFCTKTNSPESVISNKFGEEVPVENSVKLSISDNQPFTANDEREDCINDQNELITHCTKELEEAPTSIVKQRMQMFGGNLQDKTTSIQNFRRISDGKTSDKMEKISMPIVRETTASDIKYKDPSVIVTDVGAQEVQDEVNNVQDLQETDCQTVSIACAEDIIDNAENLLPPSNDKQVQEEEHSETISGACEEVIIDNAENLLPPSNDKQVQEEEHSETISGAEVIIDNAENLLSPSNDKQVQEEEHSETISGACAEVIIDNAENVLPPSNDKQVQEGHKDIELTLAKGNANFAEEVEIMITSPPVLDDVVPLNTVGSDELSNVIIVDNTVNEIETVTIQTNTVLPKEGGGSEIPSSDGRNDTEEAYPVELNPFGDEESQEEDVKESRTNPFGSDEEEEKPTSQSMSRTHLKTKPPRPPQPASRQSLTLDAKKVTKPSIPMISSNPFWSDGEEPESDDDSKPKKLPVPLPRTVKLTTPDPSPLPRLRRNSGNFGSSNSLSSAESSTGSMTRRKKKPAPHPPVPDVAPPSLLTADASPSHSTASSPRTRPRKARPAPPPPSNEGSKPLRKIEVSPLIETEKFAKDEMNRIRQSKHEEDSPFMTAVNKSMYGQWKRKKGPAPPRPVPQRREIHVLPMKDVKRELDDIDVKQLELERQGVSVEKTIRSKFEDAPFTDDSSLGETPVLEDLVMQLFEIVNEKNELFRRQAELMYLRRQHRLEEEHADLEYEIRCLMERPEHTKTDTEKAYEERLIQRLVDVVERRDEIVNCLEMDRQREVEEDRSIHDQMASFAAKGKGNSMTDSVKDKEGSTSEKKGMKLLKKKMKNKTTKKHQEINVDSEKDTDESDVSKKIMEKKVKRKWF